MTKEKSIQTLCFLHHKDNILLGMKKVRLGAGKWNGFGGKVEPGESIEAATIREMKEESGVEVSNLEKFGVLQFTAPARPLIEIHLFRTGTYTGTPVETDEMRPEWFHQHELPFAQMWQSDLYWWPRYFRNEKFTGSIEFDEHDHVIKQDIKVVATLEA